ncbi:hypothetical protein [Stakelama marina]|uniref:Uncharacterized protein n=1 Tax=Stakelama marina TaxID=2826939 RepID=A0A8T4IJ84_9SPHN|nr:hypothetical protein [Stakelama marina]MBR0552226.1 hypothetical protein [Stakelama marina]
MVSGSNAGIMSEYLIKYAAILASDRERPSELLETLYMTERFRAGDDLKSARQLYDYSIWKDVSADEIERRIAALDEYMVEFARERAAMWGLGQA